MMILLWFLILILIISSSFLTKKKQNLPPSPPRLPIIGNLHQLGGFVPRSLLQLSEKYGPVMLLKLGSVSSVVISSAEAAREILKVHDLNCCSRPSLSGAGRLSYNYKDIAFAPYSDYWREIRKISVLELFSTKRVQSFGVVREEEVASLISSLSEFAKSARPVDLSAKLFSAAAEMVLKIAFGTSLQATQFDKDRFMEVTNDAEALLGSFSAKEYFPYLGWLIDRITGYHARIERVFRELDTFYQQVIDDHLKDRREGKEQEDIVDLLLRIDWFTLEHVKAVLMNIFLAGVDTSSITLIWAMSELMRNPKVMRKAQNEVRNFVGISKDRVTESEIDHLNYLKMVIKETLRLHSPTPLLLPRETISKFSVNGYEIQPKTLIQINAWAVGRDPKYWKNPEEFIPERFIDNTSDYKCQNFEMLPFGAGRRGCPGSPMGTRMVEMVLANLLYCFDWRFPDGVENINMEEASGQSLTGCKKEALILVPVNPSEKLPEYAHN